MRDVMVKAKAKLGKVPSDDLYLALAKENNIDKKINILSKNYEFFDNSKDIRIIERDNFFALYKQLKSLDYFLSGVESDFFNLYFSKYEILFLQEMIESLVNENFSNNYLDFIANPLSDKYISDKFIIKEDMDVESFVNSNKHSKYYRILLPFLNKNMDKNSLIFLSSNALIKFYYRSLLKLSKKFPSKERNLLKSFVGEEINLQNFQMIYRLKSSYDLNDGDIFNYLIEGGNKYKAKRLKDLSMTSLDEFLKIMSESKYKDIFSSSASIQKEIRKYELNLYQNEIRKEESVVLYVISAMNIIFISGENVEALLEMDDSFTLDERLEYLIVR